MSSASGLQWYGSRVRQMSARELFWRATRSLDLPSAYVRKWAARRDDRRATATTSTELHRYPLAFTPDAMTLSHSELEQREECIRIFDLEFPVDFTFDWHRDYRHGITAPRGFSRTLNIRNTDLVGDIKYIWEINRHQYLSALAWSGYPDAETVVAESLRSWMEENHYLTGVNWTSSLELALRLISWAMLYPLLQARLAQNRSFREAFAASVYQHLREIRGRLSLYSSANNHLIGELAGLYIGSVCFPWWRESSKWHAESRELLQREIELQFTPEGVNREQAISYQLFTLEMLLAAALIGRNIGDEFPRPYWKSLRGALEYLEALSTSSGELPAIGDSDDARGFLLSAKETPLQVAMHLGALVFNEPRFAALVPQPTVAARAFLPNSCSRLAELKQGLRNAPACQIFREGVAVLADDDWKVVVDVGPLGYTSVAAHGHADALSVLLAIGNEYLIVDAGTYAYHSHPEWRSYFRGTAAHNTVRVDGQDQSVIAGRFLWSSKANVRLLDYINNPTVAHVSAEHDGYRRLSDPVVHRRTVTLHKARHEVIVEDFFSCAEEHQVELHWHLSEKARIIQESASAVRLEFGQQALSFECSGLLARLELLRGSTSPILGWRSPVFNQKMESPTLRVAGRIVGNSKVITRIAPAL